MNLKAFREEVIKADIEVLATELNISTDMYAEYEKTNEVPFEIIQKLATKTGMNFKEVAKYESHGLIVNVVDDEYSFETNYFEKYEQLSDSDFDLIHAICSDDVIEDNLYQNILKMIWVKSRYFKESLNSVKEELSEYKKNYKNNMQLIINDSIQEMNNRYELLLMYKSNYELFNDVVHKMTLNEPDRTSFYKSMIEYIDSECLACINDNSDKMEELYNSLFSKEFLQNLLYRMDIKNNEKSTSAFVKEVYSLLFANSDGLRKEGVDYLSSELYKCLVDKYDNKLNEPFNELNVNSQICVYLQAFKHGYLIDCYEDVYNSDDEYVNYSESKKRKTIWEIGLDAFLKINKINPMYWIEKGIIDGAGLWKKSFIKNLIKYSISNNDLKYLTEEITQSYTDEANRLKLIFKRVNKDWEDFYKVVTELNDDNYNEKIKEIHLVLSALKRISECYGGNIND